MSPSYLLLWCILFCLHKSGLPLQVTIFRYILLPIVTCAFNIWALTFDGGNLLITVSLPNFWLIAHIIPIFVGYAAFTISFSLSIMYLTQQRQLKHKLFGSLFNKLPSLEGIDKLMWKTISFGFPLLTLGLVFGTFWVKTQNVLGDMWYLDYKVVLGFNLVDICGIAAYASDRIISWNQDCMLDHCGFLPGTLYLYRHLLYGVKACLSRG